MCSWNRSAALALGLAMAFLLVPCAEAVPPGAPWVVRNIGPKIAPGFVDLDPRGFWTVRASNGDASANADSLFFVSQPLSGDGSIIALVFGQEGGDPLSKAGLMIRENESSGAANIHFFMTSQRGIGITYRPIARQGTINRGVGFFGLRQFPLWFRLQRSGDEFTPYSSSDGVSWQPLHSPITLPNFSKNALVGLTGCSLYDTPVSAAFGNVAVVPGQVSPTVQSFSSTGAALLKWAPVNGAIGYMVRRSAPNVPGFAADTVTPEPIKETSFSEASLPNGQALRYLVAAVFTEGGQTFEGWSTAAQVTPIPTPGNLIATDLNIETPILRGGIVFDPATGIYRISGSGSEIGGSEDHCFFVSQLLKGDFQITARVLDRNATKVGVMFRESLEGPSRMGMLAAATDRGVALQYREETGGSTGFTGRPAITAAEYRVPLFLRLVRKGNTVTSFTSLDGLTFTAAGSAKTFDPPLPESLYVGYAITSQNAGALATSTFSDLTIGPVQ